MASIEAMGARPLERQDRYQYSVGGIRSLLKLLVLGQGLEGHSWWTDVTRTVTIETKYRSLKILKIVMLHVHATLHGI